MLEHRYSFTPSIEWRRVPGWPTYEVSSDGRVRSARGELRSYLNAKGYCRLCLSDKDRRRNVGIHRLVVEAFIGPIPDGCVPNHIDSVRTNNCASNLEIVTYRQNMLHALLKGRMTCIVQKLNAAGVIEIRRRYQAGDKPREIAPDFSITRSYVCALAAWRKWKHLRDELIPIAAVPQGIRA